MRYAIFHMRSTFWIFICVIIIGFTVLTGCGAPAATEEPADVEPAAPEVTEAPASEATSEPIGEVPTVPAPAEFPTSIPTQPAPQPALPERRRLTLEFPPRMRAGDSDLVRLTLEVDDLGNVTPTAEVGGNVVTGEVIEIPNLYETHHVIAEARFDIAGMEVRPPELISEPLAPGTSAAFSWSIRPPEVGVYRGTIWFYLRFVDKSSGEESRKTVSAQIVEIEAANLLGLSGNFARTTGVIGSVVGTIIGIPFLEDIVKLLFKRRNRLRK
jgi:hypothetical protein